MTHYWPYYCEENVWWWLHEHASAAGCAVFISGASGRVIMGAQRAGEPGHGILCWDYHVIAMQRDGERGGWRIVDQDSTLAGADSGVPVDDYLHASFPPLSPELTTYAPLLRVVERNRFLADFASDRRHMRTASGDWIKPPPPWPCIGEGFNLNRYRDMTPDSPGGVLELGAFARAYGG